MTNAALRGCPLCGAHVSDGQLGLRDYRWLGDTLPGRVAPTDFDFVLERHGRFLIIEFKPPGGALPMGQRITLKALARDPRFTVWIVWHGDGELRATLGPVDARGDILVREEMSLTHLRSLVKKWYYAEED